MRWLGLGGVIAGFYGAIVGLLYKAAPGLRPAAPFERDPAVDLELWEVEMLVHEQDVIDRLLSDDARTRERWRS